MVSFGKNFRSVNINIDLLPKDLAKRATRNIILEKVGVTPEVYDNGTHYVTNQKLTLEMLKEISDYEDVVAVEGDYTEAITGLGPSHSWDEVRARIGDKDSYKYQY
jgi:hypothetical protein